MIRSTLVLALLVAGCSAAGGDPVDLDAVLAAARAEGKLVALDFSAEW